MSQQGKGATSQGAQAGWGPQREGLSGKGKEVNEQGGVTHLWRLQKGYVARGEKGDLARGADELGHTERGTCQERERERTNKGHSLSGDRRRRETSGYRKESD